MKNRKIIVALGGNALGDIPARQLELVKGAAKAIVDLIAGGNEVVVTHGNGPQIGMIQLGLDYAAQMGKTKAGIPLPECGAMSQGYIGYHLQNSLNNELLERGLPKRAVTVVTEVEVDASDPSFTHPTKPIGFFYSREEAEILTAEKGFCMREDANRGFRRMVPSPQPVDIVEKDAIRALVDAGSLVIAVGGGGIPVVKTPCGYTGVHAVIDKDLAAAKLASILHADTLLLLTAVDRVAIHWGQPDQRFLDRLSVREAEAYCAQNEFAPGSMLPKVQAAMRFAQNEGKTAIIAALDKASLAVQGQSGTVFYRA